MHTQPGHIAGRLAAVTALLCATALLALPFFWMLITSLKSPAEVAAFPPTWLPRDLRFENYADAWRIAPFARFYINSIAVAGTATLLQVVFAILMAYAFAVIRFPAKNVLFIAVIATMLLPEEMKLVPNFLLLRELGWIDRYPGLIAPAVAHAFPVFVLYQQFRQVPISLIEAAKADGASHWWLLWRVVVPTSRPALAAVTVIALVGQWNAYLWPLIVTNSQHMRTLPLGLAFLRKQAEEGSLSWNLLMSAAVFVVVPMVICYVIAQRQFIEGITRGALKG